MKLIRRLVITNMILIFIISSCNLPAKSPTPVPQVPAGTPTGNASAAGTGSISGTLWHDLCAIPDGPLPNPLPTGCVPNGSGGAVANGTKETGEPGIPGVQVALHKDDCNAPVTATAVTDGNGAYAFTNLPDAKYCVTIDANASPNKNVLVPGTWTKPTSQTTVAQLSDKIEGGNAITGFDFGWDYQFLPAYTGPIPTAPISVTATPNGTFFVVDTGANCRSGPDTSFDIITSFAAGTFVTLVGHNNDNSWWYVLTGSTNCWISATTGHTTGSIAALPLITAPPTPTTVAAAGPKLTDPIALVAQVTYPNGANTSLQVAIRVTDNGNGVNSVWMKYRYLGDGGYTGSWHTVSPNNNAAGGVNGFDYPINTEAATELSTQNGTLQYQFFAKDNLGNTTSYPSSSPLAMPIKYSP